MLFLAKPTECLAHPVDILLTHPATTRGGYGVAPTRSAVPQAGELTQLNFLSLHESNKPQHFDSAVLTRASLNSRYTRLNVRLALGAGTQVVESLIDYRLFLAKPVSTVEVSSCHENILGVVDVVSHGNQVMAVTEFCTRDLLSVAQYGRPTTAQILGIMRQVASGLRYLHLRGIAHRDLKLENIYMAGLTPKITGFTCALTHQLPAKDKLGSSPYQAPEIHKGGVYDAYLADTWALGVILVGLSTGRFPWTCTQSDPNFSRFKKDPRSYLQGLGLTKDKLLLALLLLVPDPTHRSDSASLLRSLDLAGPGI